MKYHFPIFCFISCVFVMSCSRDQTTASSLACDTENMTETRYSTNIKSIIDNSCANSGCHDGTNPSFFVEDYTTYDGILVELENGEIWDEVYVRFDMPQQGSEGLRNFTQENMELFRCWIENDFPE